MSAAVDDRTNPKDLIGQAKVDTSLLPAAGIIHGAHAMMDGAEKYGPYNWRDKAVKARVYVSAAQRHVLDYLDRQDEADDSGVHHLGHAIACLAIILDAFECGNLIDDRPTPGPAVEILDRLNAKIVAKRAEKLQATIDATWAAESKRLIDEAERVEAEKKARRSAAAAKATKPATGRRRAGK